MSSCAAACSTSWECERAGRLFPENRGRRIKNGEPRGKRKPRGFGEYFIEFAHRARKKGFRITEVGYVLTTREQGVSKSDGNFLLFCKLGLQYVLKIIKVRLWG